MLDLLDMQGNILRGYRSFHFARFLWFAIDTDQGGRELIEKLLARDWVTPGQWRARPTATTNIAFSFAGLRALRLQADCLASFPPEFQAGMKHRAALLGDVGDCAPEHWDKPWCDGDVDVLITCYAGKPQDLDARCNEILTLALEQNGVRALPPHQDAALLLVNGKPSRREHFGFEDGFSNPDVEGVPDNGGPGDTGNPDEQGQFRPVPLGEFVLGHRAEGGEVGPMPAPRILARNGSYLVIRKLEQDVVGFRRFVKDKAILLGRALAGTLPTGAPVEEYLAAKMLGRWRDGSSLDLYPTKPAGDPGNGFAYADDPDGARCPLGAHTRRVNPRASLGFGGNIVRRRRLIRRGIAYGEWLPDPTDASGAAPAGVTAGSDDGGRRGIMFQAFNANISHQFEFVQQQWVNYGDEFRQGDDTDPITGIRNGDGRMVVPSQEYRRDQAGKGRMVIPGDQRTGRPPFLCGDIPRFVTTKGGDYFFAPSLTALRLLASGKVIVS